MANNGLRLCTWNVCLGLKYKLNYVKGLLVENSIDILCIQEAEIAADDNKSMLEIPEYNIKLEEVSASNTIRTIMYIRSSINYVRHQDLERADAHIILITCQGLGIASLYRTYKLTGHANHQDAFEEQLVLLSAFFMHQKNYITLGDFNLDDGMDLKQDYCNRSLLKTLREFAIEKNLLQVVDFNTWSRTINGIKKESLLDHVYIDCFAEFEFGTPSRIRM